MLKSKLQETLPKQSLPTIAIVKRWAPFGFTFANACLGLLSIIQAVEGNYSMAVYCSLIAIIMDQCDGRLARAFGTTSKLGSELDALADAISFCLAPCILIYAWFPGTFGYTGSIALMLYLCAGIFRLAKFNSTAQEADNNFIGLPTGVAAFFIMSLVLYSRWIVNHPLKFMLYKQMPFILMGLIALLMLSSIPFPSFKTYRPAHPAYCTAAILSTMLLYIAGYPSLFISVNCYILASIARWIYRKAS